MNIIYYEIEVDDVRTILSHKHFEYSSEYLEIYRDEIVYPIPGRIGPLEVIAQSPNRIVVKGALHAFCIWAAEIKGHSEQEFSPFRLIEAVWMLREIIGEEIGEAIAEDLRRALKGYTVFHMEDQFVTSEQACDLANVSEQTLKSWVQDDLIDEYEIYNRTVYRVGEVLDPIKPNRREYPKNRLADRDIDTGHPSS